MEFQTDNGNFSFTFTIPGFKNVYYQGNRRPYGKLTQERQYDFLENHLQHINKFPDIKWVYEEHEDTRLHIHGWVKNTCGEEMDDFRHRFYSHPVAMTQKSYEKISNIQKTLFLLDYFDVYMKKNQHKIKYFMRVIENERIRKAMDEGVYIEPNISAQYVNSLEQHLESEMLGNEYNFGKKHNKFIIEL